MNNEQINSLYFIALKNGGQGRVSAGAFSKTLMSSNRANARALAIGPAVSEWPSVREAERPNHDMVRFRGAGVQTLDAV